MDDKENGNKMFKIEKLTMVDFGTFVGKQEIVFSTDEKKNLTVIDTGGGKRESEYLTIINAIRNAFGLQNHTGLGQTFYPLPEDYYENAKSSVDTIGSSVVNSENEFLFFPDIERLERYITEKPYKLNPQQRHELADKMNELKNMYISKISNAKFSFHSWFNAVKVVAALLLPPPKPLPIGICFFRWTAYSVGTSSIFFLISL